MRRPLGTGGQGVPFRLRRGRTGQLPPLAGELAELRPRPRSRRPRSSGREPRSALTSAPTRRPRPRSRASADRSVAGHDDGHLAKRVGQTLPLSRRVDSVLTHDTLVSGLGSMGTCLHDLSRRLLLVIVQFCCRSVFERLGQQTSPRRSEPQARRGDHASHASSAQLDYPHAGDAYDRKHVRGTGDVHQGEA
jgi:hypothetical protein